MKNTMKTTTKETGRKIARYFFLGLLLITFALIITSNIVDAFNFSSTEALQNTYSQQMEILGRQVKATCDIEIDLAKSKLADHYSDRIKLESNDIARLGAKAEGKNLECKSFL